MSAQLKLCKDIPGFGGLYAVSTDGRVWSHKSERWMKSPCDSSGYPCVALYKSNRRTTYRVHQLVAMTYLKFTDQKFQVNHKNGIKTDNRVENLEWVSQIDNIKHAIATGLHKGLSSATTAQRSANGKARRLLSPKDVARVKRLAAKGVSGRQIAKQYLVADSVVQRILRGETYGEYKGRFWEAK